MVIEARVATLQVGEEDGLSVRIEEVNPDDYELMTGLPNEVNKDDSPYVQANSSPASRIFVQLQLTKSKFGKKDSKFLYDTGAAVSLMSSKDFKYAQSNGMVLRKLKANVTVTNASRQQMKTKGCYDIQFLLQGKMCHAAFIVSDDMRHHGIMGMNIIRKYHLVLDPYSDTISSPSQTGAAVAELHVPEEDTWDIEVANTTTIPARSARLVPLRLVSRITGKPLKEEREFLAHLGISVLINSNSDGRFFVHIPNAGLDIKELTRGTTLGHAEPKSWFNTVRAEKAVEATELLHPQPRREHTDAEKAEIRKELKASIARTVPYSEREDYLELLMKHEASFSADRFDLGRTDLLEHTIDLEDKSPVFVPQYRLPLEQLRMIKENVTGWLAAGIIERSNSHYNAAVFCVPKKPGSTEMRTVVDYRGLNHRTLLDKYSIRTPEECIEEVGRSHSKVFTSLDLTHGFWQLPLKPEHRQYTAFTIPGVGQFQYTVTGMGLMGGPASFSRLMDMVFRDAENILTFIDDILVHSKDHKSHLRHLNDAISRLASANLLLNARKCVFGSSSVSYLGHTLTAAGVLPGADKSSALAALPPPASHKALKSFLGLANYFRPYLKNFATLSAPLFCLTRNSSTWKGGTLPPNALECFNEIQKRMAARPLMAYPKREGKLHLFVDAALGDHANEGGLGATLMQTQPNGHKKPIGYASRRLLPHEKNYPAFLAEMQAAVFGMDHFHHNLVGRRFNLYTDHKPMCQLSKVHTKTLNRLQLKMQEMHPDIRYVSGKDNTIADFLSRYQGIGVAVVDAHPFRLTHMQRADPDLAPVLEEAKKQVDTEGIHTFFQPESCRTRMQVRLEQGVLVRKAELRKGAMAPNRDQVLAPAALVKELIREAHNSNLGGHTGIFKTSERIRTEFWWPTMDRDIAAHIKECATCQRAGDKKTLPVPPLQSLPELSRPSERIHIDLFGPLKVEENETAYVLVVTDAFSKLANLFLLPDKSAVTVAETLLNKYLMVFGIPDRIVSDQGLEFCNEFQRIIWDGLGINHSVTTPYHPQCNSQAEVFNKTMAWHLKTALLDSEKSSVEWPLYLAPLQFSHNTAVNKATRVTPFYATFGYDPRIPLWEGLDFMDAHEVPEKGSYADRMSQLHHSRHVARNLVHHNNQHARQVGLDQHAKHAKVVFPTYKPGDLVWVAIKQVMRNPKLSPRYEEGTIVERTGVATYRVRRDERTRKKMATLNVSLMKPRSEQDDSEDHEFVAHSPTQDQDTLLSPPAPASDNARDGDSAADDEEFDPDRSLHDRGLEPPPGNFQDGYVQDEFAPETDIGLLSVADRLESIARSIESIALMTDYEPSDVHRLLEQGYSIVMPSSHNAGGGGGGGAVRHQVIAPQQPALARALQRLQDFLPSGSRDQAPSPAPHKRGEAGKRLRSLLKTLSPRHVAKSRASKRSKASSATRAVVRDSSQQEISAEALSCAVSSVDAVTIHHAVDQEASPLGVLSKPHLGREHVRHPIADWPCRVPEGRPDGLRDGIRQSEDPDEHRRDGEASERPQPCNHHSPLQRGLRRRKHRVAKEGVPLSSNRKTTLPLQGHAQPQVGGLAQARGTEAQAGGVHPHRLGGARRDRSGYHLHDLQGKRVGHDVTQRQHIGQSWKHLSSVRHGNGGLGAGPRRPRHGNHRRDEGGLRQGPGRGLGPSSLASGNITCEPIRSNAVRGYAATPCSVGYPRYELDSHVGGHREVRRRRGSRARGPVLHRLAADQDLVHSNQGRLRSVPARPTLQAGIGNEHTSPPAATSAHIEVISAGSDLSQAVHRSGQRPYAVQDHLQRGDAGLPSHGRLLRMRHRQRGTQGAEHRRHRGHNPRRHTRQPLPVGTVHTELHHGKCYVCQAHRGQTVRCSAGVTDQVRGVLVSPTPGKSVVPQLNHIRKDLLSPQPRYAHSRARLQGGDEDPYLLRGRRRVHPVGSTVDDSLPLAACSRNTGTWTGSAQAQETRAEQFPRAQCHEENPIATRPGRNQRGCRPYRNRRRRF